MLCRVVVLAAAGIFHQMTRGPDATIVLMQPSAAYSSAKLTSEPTTPNGHLSTFLRLSLNSRTAVASPAAVRESSNRYGLWFRGLPFQEVLQNPEPIREQVGAGPVST